MSDRTHIAIVYFSAEGHTEAIADAIARGAAQVWSDPLKVVQIC